MNILIDNKNGMPIYEQIYTQIKNQIISDSLKEDELLPSIRNLAKDLHISVITTKRAYDELEKDGYIYTVAGKGCFVAHKNIELLKEENFRKIEERIQEIAQLAKIYRLSKNEIIKIIDLVFEEE
ncbi:MAG: GntR family transcriptional regulator [Acutalibacteraceae bacterium]|nr:GntR family transcriptional regulator [Acutalibacteraceae bacterium]